ncbi:bacillithiol biosynthesis BshC, partial [Candidatus Bipolaricaulota bacterium]
MMQSIDPRLLYSESPFFLDVLEGKESATAFFEHSLASVGRMAEARQAFPDQETRSETCDALLEYNRMLDASAEAMGNIERLRTVNALCVIGGQQAGFLGGPLFVIYKIVSVIRMAGWLSDRLKVPVVPIFWLASEDHDFAEINHTRWLDDSGALRTISFDWEEQGHAIEQMPMTEAVRHAFNEAKRKVSFSRASDAAIFKPEESDDYCRWHARIWSRLFSHDGLILVEPHVLRPMAQPFFMRALSEPNVIRAGLAQGAARLTEHGYPVPLDLSSVGTLFEISMDGKRQRIEPPLEGTAATIGHPPAETYSTDAALRPLLADSLLPTIANILGPSELAYHAMLCPLYKQWNIP